MKLKILITVLIGLLILALGAAVGSVYISPLQIVNIILNKFFNVPLRPEITEGMVSILLSLRIPRALTAFLVGGALAVSGAVMQSALKNPLASSYTLGVSSGATLGAGCVMLLNITMPLLGNLLLPSFGLVFGTATVILAVTFASKFDKNMDNHTIILTGMVFSLFANAIITIMLSLNKQGLQRLVFWQMGSFSAKDWQTVAILAPLVIILCLIILRFEKELDILSFGEEQAKSLGINSNRLKWILLCVSAALTGGAVAFVGVIGFIDLIAPHVVRKIFGSKHREVIPMSFIYGGGFMVLCDLIARTVILNTEIPVGAVTALAGAPFFLYVYFAKKKKAA